MEHQYGSYHAEHKAERRQGIGHAEREALDDVEPKHGASSGEDAAEGKLPVQEHRGIASGRPARQQAAGFV